MKKMIGFSIVLTIFFAGLILASCNVTRTVTTSASHFKSGDTTTTIVTKTIESYDAKKYQNR